MSSEHRDEVTPRPTSSSEMVNLAHQARLAAARRLARAALIADHESLEVDARLGWRLVSTG